MCIKSKHIHINATLVTHLKGTINSSMVPYLEKVGQFLLNLLHIVLPSELTNFKITNLQYNESNL